MTKEMKVATVSDEIRRVRRSIGLQGVVQPVVVVASPDAERDRWIAGNPEIVPNG